jgi:hypothetical protein
MRLHTPRHDDGATVGNPIDEIQQITSAYLVNASVAYSGPAHFRVSFISENEATAPVLTLMGFATACARLT